MGPLSFRGQGRQEVAVSISCREWEALYQATEMMTVSSSLPQIFNVLHTQISLCGFMLPLLMAFQFVTRGDVRSHTRASTETGIRRNLWIILHLSHDFNTLKEIYCTNLELTLFAVYRIMLKMLIIIFSGELWSGLQHCWRNRQSPHSWWSRDLHHQDHPWRSSCYGWAAGVSYRLPPAASYFFNSY